MSHVANKSQSRAMSLPRPTGRPDVVVRSSYDRRNDDGELWLSQIDHSCVQLLQHRIAVGSHSTGVVLQLRTSQSSPDLSNA